MFARNFLKVLCGLGARFVGQLVPCPGAENEISMSLKNAIAGLQEGIRGSVCVFVNGLADALRVEQFEGSVACDLTRPGPKGPSNSRIL